MKRMIAMLLSLVLLMGLCACGGTQVEEPAVPAETVAAYEEYARAAAAVGKYASGETLVRAVLWSGDGLSAALSKKLGSLETFDLSNAQAVVLLYTDKGARVLVMDAEHQVVHKVASEGISFSYGTEAVAEVYPMGVHPDEMGETLAAFGFNTTGSVEDILRVQAQLELDYEAYCAEANAAAVLEKYAEQIAAIRALGTDYTLNEDWLRLQAAEPVLAECGAYERAIEIAKRYAAFTDELAGRQEKEEYEFEALILEFFEDEALLEEEVSARLNWVKQQLEVEKLAGDAAKFVEPIAERAAALKQNAGLAYYTNPEYYTLRREALEAAGKNTAYERYEQAEWIAWLRELDAQFAAERRTAATDYESAYIEGSWPALIEFNASYRKAAIELADAEWELAAYETKHEQALTAYNEATEAIRANYEDDGYLRDMDYIKLEITNEELLVGLSERTARRGAAADAVSVLMAAYEAKVTELEAAFEQAVYDELNAKEVVQVKDKLLAIAEERRAEASPASEDEEVTMVLLEEAADGTLWLESTEAFAGTLEGLTSTYVKPSSGGSYGGGKKNNTTTGAGGYDMPNPGESFSDYVQRVDPDLYDSITDRYNSLK